MNFLCRLGTPEGAVIEEVHQGRDAESLRQDLARKGYHVFEVRPRGLQSALSLGRGRRGRKVSAQRFLVFNQEMAALLGAGLPLMQSLELLLERLKDPLFRSVLQDIRDRVESGQELSTAFEAHGDLFPRLYSSTLRAGERSGDLETVIRRFVRYLKLVLEARKRVFSALVYPAVLVVLSAAMIAIMTVFVVPRFSVFYQDLNAELPKLTQITLGIGQFFQDRLGLVLAVTVVGVLLLRRWLRTEAARLAVDRAKLRIPVLGAIFHRFSVGEFARALATLVEGGLPLVPSLEIAVGAVDNAWVRHKLEPCIQKVREGKSLHSAVDESGVVDELGVDMIKVGETTGALGTMLGNIADFLDQDVEIRLQRLLSLVEPFMLVVMGVIIALLLVSVYLPLFSVLGDIN
jgi:type IV pilus assembly protein PilC